MKYEFSYINTQIIAEYHNPSIFTPDFLKRIDIIEDESEIIRDKLIISPNFSNVSIKGETNIDKETNIQLDRKLLTIASNNMKTPFLIAKKYISNLPHIKALTIGINLGVTISDIDVNDWFIANVNMKNTIVQTITLELGEHDCNIGISRKDKGILLLFNFHYDINDIFQNITHFDFITKANDNKTIAERFINENFKN